MTPSRIRRIVSGRSAGDTWSPGILLPDFVEQVPGILHSQDPATGRFGTPPFIVTDQNVLWPLAVAWSHDSPDNPFYRDSAVFDAILSGGDALIAEQDRDGKFEFRKKDGSTWGQIYMPWTYSRWIRAWGIVRPAMAADQRQRWDDAIGHAVQGMVDTALTVALRNIPVHDAMAIYRAAQVLDRDDWKAAAVDYLHRAADEQDNAGFWSEHSGPVVTYNFVYVDALGTYYGMSADPYVVPALDRATKYHAALTYPDGSPVETVDERNYYRRILVAPNVGFTFTPEGRCYVEGLIGIHRHEHTTLGADGLASLLAYGGSGPITRPPTRPVLGDDDAMTVRNGPWFAALSAFSSPLADSRWIQDRQAFLSVFHDRTGLILTGGNTKLQPLWSTFTAGNTALLRHSPGDTDPDFGQRDGLLHAPSEATLDTDGTAIHFAYGSAQCVCRLDIHNRESAEIGYELVGESTLPVAAHAVFLPHIGEKWQTALTSGRLDERPLTLTSRDCGGWFGHHGWRLTLPDNAVVSWPVYPHNPYAKDGSAELADARIVVTIELGTQPRSEQLAINIASHPRPSR
jgi:hypothetical protein